MIISTFKMREVTVPFYEVRGLPLIGSLLIFIISLAVLVVNVPPTRSATSQMPPLSSFLLAAVVIFIVAAAYIALFYFPLRALVARRVRRYLDRHGYQRVVSFRKLTTQQIRDNIAQRYREDEYSQLLMIDYRGEYLLYKK